jgi:hypothetical protein
MFHSGVCPILDYCSETWGFKNYSQIDAIQNKAIRIFLGVHRYAPLAAINGDMGWSCSRTRRQLAMIRMWNRIMLMESDRLPRIVLRWDQQFYRNNWSSEIRTIFRNINQSNSFNNIMQTVSTTSAWSLLHEKHCANWNLEINTKPKLRTYKVFKNQYEAEPYVISFMNRSTRSCIAQLRCGILPLLIETGRWVGIEYESRICKICNSNSEVENEYHFLFHCNFYNDQRNNFSERVVHVFPGFINLSDNEKIRLCMSKLLINIFSNYVHCIFGIRQHCIFG